MSSSELVVDGVTERSNGRTRGPLVVLEGTNATGKSSVVTDLAARLDAQGFHFPPAFVAFREEVGLDSCVAPIPRLVYYLAGILHLSSLIDEAMTKGPVVCDRYAASPLGAVIADGEPTEEEVLSLFSGFEPHIARPDLTILLRCDHAAARARLEARNRREGSLHVLHRRSLESPAYFRRTHEAIRRQVYRMGPVVEIDTTGRTVEETREAAWLAVQAHIRTA
jgi:thymidylate kinase